MRKRKNQIKMLQMYHHGQHIFMYQITSLLTIYQLVNIFYIITPLRRKKLRTGHAFRSRVAHGKKSDAWEFPNAEVHSQLKLRKQETVLNFKKCVTTSPKCGSPFPNR